MVAMGSLQFCRQANHAMALPADYAPYSRGVINQEFLTTEDRGSPDQLKVISLRNLESKDVEWDFHESQKLWLRQLSDDYICPGRCMFR